MRFETEDAKVGILLLTEKFDQKVTEKPQLVKAGLEPTGSIGSTGQCFNHSATALNLIEVVSLHR